MILVTGAKLDYPGDEEGCNTGLFGLRCVKSHMRAPLCFSGTDFLSFAGYDQKQRAGYLRTVS